MAIIAIGLTPPLCPKNTFSSNYINDITFDYYLIWNGTILVVIERVRVSSEMIESGKHARGVASKEGLTPEGLRALKWVIHLIKNPVFH